MHYNITKDKSRALDNIKNKSNELTKKEVFLYLPEGLYNRIKIMAYRKKIGVSTLIREILKKEFRIDQPILHRPWKKNTKLPC